MLVEVASSPPKSIGPARLVAKNLDGVAVPTASDVPIVSAPEKVEVPKPETFRRFVMLNEVVDAIGNVDAIVVEVAVYIDAVGDEVATILVLEVQKVSMFVPPVPVMVPPPLPQAAPTFFRVPSGRTETQSPVAVPPAKPFTCNPPLMSWLPMLVDVAPAEPKSVVVPTENPYLFDGELVPTPTPFPLSIIVEDVPVLASTTPLSHSLPKTKLLPKTVQPPHDALISCPITVAPSEEVATAIPLPNTCTPVLPEIVLF